LARAFHTEEELKRLALDPHAAIREAAVMGIADETFLLARVHARAHGMTSSAKPREGELIRRLWATPWPMWR
jgi:hypothetical protein